MQRTLLLCFMFLTSACAHNSLIAPEDSANAVSQILDQVNGAIEEARAAQPKSNEGPDISSVEVDLQLSANTGASAGFPLGLIFPLAEATKTDLHRISLTFAPKPAIAAASTVRPDPALTSAVQQIYRAIAQANPNYQFQRGTMSIECTLQNSLSASTSGSGSGGSGSSSGSGTGGGGSAKSSSSLVLVPVQIGASASSESVQTIILTFAPHGSSPTPTAAPEATAVPPSPSHAP